MKKGFTLIEILAVIVLLAVVALIAYPLIIGVIKLSKENAFKDSVINTEQAAFNYLSGQVLFKDEPDTTCYIFDYTNDVSEVIFAYTKDSKNYYKAPVKLMDVKNDNFIEGNIIVCKNETISNLSDGTNSYVSGKVSDGNLSSNDESAPIINDITFLNTSRKITAVIDASEDELGKINKYYFSLDGKEYIETTSNTYSFDKLNSNQEYTVYVKVNNMALLEDSMNKKTNTLEINVPTYNISPTGYATSKVLTINYPNGYTNEYSLDGGDSWDLYTEALIIKNNINVIARVNDGINYVNGSSYSIANIDLTEPVITKFYRTGITSKALALTVDANDPESSIVKYEFKQDNGSWVTTSGNNYLFNNLISLKDYTFYVRVTNGAGAITEMSIIDRANACPTTTFSIDKVSYATSKTLSITYPSGHSTCTIKEYSLDGTSWLSATGNGNSNTTTQVLTLNSNQKVYTRRRDGINTVSDSYDVINIDTTVPSAALSSSTITSKSVLLTASCLDANSGIIRYEFSKDNGTTYINNSDSPTYTFDNLVSNTYNFRVRCTNGAGLINTSLVSAKTTSITIPTYAVSPSGYSASKVVSIVYPSGYTKEYSINGGTSWNTYTTGVTFTSNGSIIARVSDGVNYVNGSSFTVANIDTTAPSVAVSVSGKVGTITLADNLMLSGYTVTTSSTVPTSWTSITGTSSTQSYTASSAGTYYAWVKDATGNTAYKSFTILSSAFSYSAVLSNYGATYRDTSYGAGCTKMCTCSGCLPGLQGEGYCNGMKGLGYSINWTCSYYCPSGGSLSGSTCIKGEYYCPSGGTLSGSTCTLYTCPNGGTLSGTTCVV